MSCLCLWLGKVSGIIVSSCSWESQCLQLSVLVSADYVVQVELVSYSNPSNTRSDGRCCDPGKGPCSGWERCDTYFIYCLILRASTATVCTNKELTTRSSVIWNGADINFSQPTVLGLPNPFKLTGISATWEVIILKRKLFFNLSLVICYCRQKLSFTYKCLILMTLIQMILLCSIE